MSDCSQQSANNDRATDAFYEALLEDDAEALYERAPCGYLSTTPGGTIIKVNQTFLTWTGYSRTDLVGRRSFADLLTPGGRIYHETHYAPMLQMHGSAREIALDVIGAHGQRLPSLVNSVLERSEAGHPLVVRTAVFDAADRRRYERELLGAKQRAEASEAEARRLARTLQQTLIPPTLPDIDGLDVAAKYRPAGSGEEVGGDFYDAFEVGPSDWVIAMGDVSGKGADAAVVTALARHTIRAAAVRQPSERRMLEVLNEALLHHETDRFCTVTLVRLRRTTAGWSATVTSGGHPLPILLRPARTPELVGRPGSLLGLFPTAELHTVKVALHPGDALLLYTDGVTEARNDEGFFGEAALFEAAARHVGGAVPLTDGILDDVVAFQGGYPRDDIALVCVRVNLPS